MTKTFTTEEVLAAFDRHSYNPDDYNGHPYEEELEGEYYYLGQFVDWDELADDLADSWHYDDDENYVNDGPKGGEIEGLGWVSIPENFGGEGMGDDRWVVFYIEATGQYFKKSGYYASYDGTNWGDGDFAVVSPKEKVVTVYE